MSRARFGIQRYRDLFLVHWFVLELDCIMSSSSVDHRSRCARGNLN
jgi:hypothetical protein